MNDQTQVAATEAAEEQKTRIRPDLNRYVRDKSGRGKRTHRTDDFVARSLAGKELDVIKQGASLLGIDHAKWEHLNPGQQRMLIGNALRHRLADVKNGLEEREISDVYGEPVAPYEAKEEAAAPAQEEAKPEPEPEAPVPSKKRVSKKQ